ncbi:AsmA family protein [Swaminathania salitolerans]|uniref:AsmA domain-containing protein n=1 Tax=Swaminathania salitolerans TaxID=182838 RepID=A0A511BLX6_9PROT|nr:AsmA family protein [Swaminathania salitolerans]GBQ10578.1 hypothetical protein AA21291_0482 [Swaminathania salitolerans LMG 21291]GEL01341.1 hypothetical protein SSA02_05040 [Swaminathania salitolerans]
MRRFLIVLIVFLVLVTGAAVATDILIDRSNLRQSVIAAVRRQSGRELTMSRFSVQVLPWPGFSARNVTLTDPDGVTPMLEARDVRASLALLPLLWREIRLENLRIVQGSIALRRERQGEANWVFHPVSPAPGKEKGTAGRSAHPQARWGLRIGSVRLDRAHLSLDDRVAHRSGAVDIDHAEFDGLASSAPYLDIHGHRGGEDPDAVPFRLNGHIGPLSLLTGANPPWALSLGATLGRDKDKQDWLNFDGQITDTRHLRGFSGVLRGEIAALTDLERLFPHAALPDIRGLGGEIGLYDADTGTGTDDRGAVSHDVSGRDSATGDVRQWLSRLGVNHVHLHAGSAPPVRGVAAKDVHIDADTLSSAFAVSATLSGEGIFPGAQSLAMQGTFGTLAQANTAWQTALQQGLDVDVTLRDAAMAGLSSGLKLQIGGHVSAAGSSLRLEGEAASLPVRAATFHDLSLSAALTREADSMLRIRDAELKSHEVGAHLTGVASRPDFSDFQGSLQFDHLDLDALDGLWHGGNGTARRDAQDSPRGAPQAAIPPLPGGLAKAVTGTMKGAAPGGGTPPRDTATDNAPGTERGPVPARHAHVSSWLKRAAARLVIGADSIHVYSVDYTGVKAYLVADPGVVVLDRVSAKGPVTARGGDTALSGTLRYDLTGAVPRLSVAFSPFLFPSGLAQSLLGLPGYFEGPLMLVGELTATGESSHALRDSLSGHIGLSMVGGQIEAKAIAPYLGNQAGALLSHGHLPVRCFGVRAVIAGGSSRIDPIGLEAGPLSLAGSGTYSLKTQALDLHLMPRIGFGGTGASTAIAVEGTLERPSVHQAANGDGRFEITIGGATQDPCPALLGTTREGHEGAAPAERKKHMQASDLLHGLGILH